MKIQKIFYVLVMGLLMLTLTGATSVMAQGTDDGTCKSTQSSCPAGGKSVKNCTPAEKVACQTRNICDAQSKKCEPSKRSATCGPKKDDTGI